MSRAKNNRTEPAHALLYDPASLTPPADPLDTDALIGRVESYRPHTFNARQRQAISRSFTERFSLLWGPPGTGKTTVLAAIVLCFLERAWAMGEPVTIGIGAGNYSAIDNLLTPVADLLKDRAAAVGEPQIPTTVTRVRSSYAEPSTDNRLVDVERGSSQGSSFAQSLDDPEECRVVGGTWMQLEKLAKGRSEEEEQAASWFDLLLIDEASQVGVAHAAAYFLLLDSRANVVLAGDHRQLGPIHSFRVDDTESGLFESIFSYAQDTHGVPRTALDTNYRTNDEIAAWPRQRFYTEGYESLYPSRRLELDCTETKRPVGWPEQIPYREDLLRILDPELPVAVITYPEQPYTLSNPFEAQQVVALTLLYRCLLEEQHGILTEEEFWHERLGLVTPHRAQMSSVRNLLGSSAGMEPTSLPFVDTVDRFQGQERDMIIASYTVADRDFVASEAEFILDPRRFNVTLTRARSKFVMFVSEAVVGHLPTDAEVARNAAHLQLFVQNYCNEVHERISLSYRSQHGEIPMPCRIGGRQALSETTSKTSSAVDDDDCPGFAASW